MNIRKNASKIDLSNQGLSEIPEDLFKCNYLTKLDLSHNNLTILPKNISSLRFLKTLNLSHNKISNLYANVFEIRSLEVLVLSNNELRNIPQQIEKLVNLKKLIIASNELEDLPQNFPLLQKLSTLDISNNLFRQFPRQILEIQSLQNVWLCKNNFDHFPSAEILSQLTSLKRIYCFSSIQGSIFSSKNDYEILQRKKGNCLEALKLISKQVKLPNTQTRRTGSKNLFISYSHRDTQFKDEIEIALRGIPYIGYQLDFWSDSRLDAGDLMDDTIKNALANSRIVVNIISRHYLASKFIQEIELPKMLEKAVSDGTLILNVIAGSCLFEKTALGKFVAINDPKSPLNKLRDSEQDDVYLALTRRIIKELEMPDDSH